MAKNIKKLFQKRVISLMDNWVSDKVKTMRTLRVPKEITLVGIPDDNAKKTIESFSRELKSVEPRQHFYSHRSFHITFVGRMPANTKITSKQKELLKEMFQKKKLSFNINGVSVYRSGLAVIAYPIDFDISAIRNEVRGIFKENGTGYNDVFENLAWISILRFSQKPTDKLKRFVFKNLKTELCKTRLVRIKLLQLDNIMIHNKINKTLFEVEL